MQNYFSHASAFASDESFINIPHDGKNIFWKISASEDDVCGYVLFDFLFQSHLLSQHKQLTRISVKVSSVCAWEC